MVRGERLLAAPAPTLRRAAAETGRHGAAHLLGEARDLLRVQPGAVDGVLGVEGALDGGELVLVGGAQRGELEVVSAAAATSSFIARSCASAASARESSPGARRSLARSLPRRSCSRASLASAWPRRVPAYLRARRSSTPLPPPSCPPLPLLEPRTRHLPLCAGTHVGKLDLMSRRGVYEPRGDLRLSKRALRAHERLGAFGTRERSRLAGSAGGPLQSRHHRRTRVNAAAATGSGGCAAAWDGTEAGG